VTDVHDAFPGLAPPPGPPLAPPPSPPLAPPPGPPLALTARVERWTAAIGAAAALLLCVSTVTLFARLADDPGVAAVDVPVPRELPAEVAPPAAVSEAVAEAARAAAGCSLLVDGAPLVDRDHVDLNSAPPPAALYPDHRPAHSGRHYPQTLAVPERVPSEPIDERAVVHNMEHGSVVIWFDASQVHSEVIGVMQDWMRERRVAGFESSAAGGVFVSPAAVISSGRAVALRAWGYALDCDRFDITVADAFLQDHWGSHGISPEAHLSPYPDDATTNGTAI